MVLMETRLHATANNMCLLVTEDVIARSCIMQQTKFFQLQANGFRRSRLLQSMIDQTGFTEFLTIRVLGHRACSRNI